ncbi:hypothetical protein SAMN06265365_13212 [Tistlia consotensis]|uniref:DUF4175 domain-containing protein n=1 Tax=Tistlia consotensis USBA 355 TaxID=560819 RepID=A0A1Y6CMV0_9PROT|nr:hypothetical protein [Tistlia consotensis]SMF76068.1 hypothetical protein SAMN05428998_13512 [Tistlia consotensis USBA 355]SNS12128.1 hypothetical protein SAMN06265365_13212 [Tistlia consotensis]
MSGWHLPPLGLSRVWDWPLALGLLSVAGLVSALVGEHGLWLALCWLGLGMPLLVVARYWLWPSAPRRR